jgi:hypothetical protein
VLRLVARVLSLPVQAYITSQRNRLDRGSERLSLEQKARFAPYFSSHDLQRVRVVVQDPLPITQPPLTSLVRRLGFNFPGLEETAAITFDHVISSRGPMSASLLFHELVHTVQYRVLGVPKFAEEYVRGFLVSRYYHEIPLERTAFQLEHRFTKGDAPFSVETEILRDYDCTKSE